MPADELETLVQGVLRADKPSVARALNLVESRRREDRATIARLLDRLDRESGASRGHRIGLTGPPGVGKSTLASAMALDLRGRGSTVGIVAVDPTSVVSGGSLLGDRARMGALSGDDGVFVRSYATAGEPGGVTSTALASVSVLAAAYDTVVVETVGVGQTETDVTMIVDTVVLVLQPGSGDTLQFLKAGIMEIPDVLVVQKADHDELAHRALADLGSALRVVRSTRGGDRWQTPALATSALHGRGVRELVDATTAHRAAVESALPQRRSEGSIAWAMHEFVREHGRYGVAALGGDAALRATMRADSAAGAHAFTLAHLASSRFLSNPARGGDPGARLPEKP